MKSGNWIRKYPRKNLWITEDETSK